MSGLIYISNTKIPSSKANTYQSLCMCEAFADFFDSVEFWHPSRKNDYASGSVSIEAVIEQTFHSFGIRKVFKLRRIFSLDLPWIEILSSAIWFYIEALSFSLVCLLRLKISSTDDCIFIRDGVTLSALAYCKRIGLIRHKVFFEAHLYSEREARHAKYVDGVVTINNHLKVLYNRCGVETVFVAHDGVKQAELNKIFNPINLDKGSKKIIMYCGNLFRWKGVYTLADCVNYLPENLCMYFIGGSPDVFQTFKNYVGTKKNIVLFGYKPRNEIPYYLDQADIFVLPNSSKDEMSSYTSPLKLFEYMAARKPIVASRIPAIQEILKDQYNAILFAPDDPKDLAEKIKWVLENDCSLLVEQAWQDVQGYTWNERAKRIVSWMKTISLMTDVR